MSMLLAAHSAPWPASVQAMLCFVLVLTGHVSACLLLLLLRLVLLSTGCLHHPALEH
jgi:hypothetical protein